MLFDLISLDHMASISVKGLLTGLYLQSLITNQCLAWVLVDEGHLILTQDGFCPVMHHGAWLAGLSVNLVVMMATLPVACEQTLMARLGCHVYHVLRQPST